MGYFDLIELVALAETRVGPVVDTRYRRLIEWDLPLDDRTVAMLLLALKNIL